MSNMSSWLRSLLFLGVTLIIAVIFILLPHRVGIISFVLFVVYPSLTALILTGLIWFLRVIGHIGTRLKILLITSESPDLTSRKFQRIYLLKILTILLLILLSCSILFVWPLSYQIDGPTIFEHYSLRFIVILTATATPIIISMLMAIIRRETLFIDLARIAKTFSNLPMIPEFTLISIPLFILILLEFGKYISKSLPIPFLVVFVFMIYVGIARTIFGSLTPLQATRLRANVFLIIFGIVSAALIIEIGLRTVPPQPMLYRILPANLSVEFHPVPNAMPGIEGISSYTTDEFGIRGDPYSNSDNYHILAIGGSTTEDLFLDDTEAWTYLLQQNLNQHFNPDDTQVWVGNVGKSGYSLVDHIYATKYFVPQLEIDAVIVMVGINDLTPVLQNPNYSPSSEDPNNSGSIQNSFNAYPSSTPPVTPPVHLAIIELLHKQLQQSLVSIQEGDIRIDDQAGSVYFRRRELFHNAPLLNKLPDLQPALEQYEKNLITLINTAREQNIRLIMTTQPVIYSDTISPQAESLLWMAYYGHIEDAIGRYSPKILRDAMDQFNNRLLSVCDIYNIECIDLATEMNGNELFFYDDVHFNERGASKVAELVANYLIERSLQK